MLGFCQPPLDPGRRYLECIRIFKYTTFIERLTNDLAGLSAPLQVYPVRMIYEETKDHPNRFPLVFNIYYLKATGLKAPLDFGLDFRNNFKRFQVSYPTKKWAKTHFAGSVWF